MNEIVVYKKRSPKRSLKTKRTKKCSSKKRSTKKARSTKKRSVSVKRSNKKRSVKRSTKKRSTKKRSTKKRSTKKRSTKKRSTKKRSTKKRSTKKRSTNNEINIDDFKERINHDLKDIQKEIKIRIGTNTDQSWSKEVLNILNYNDPRHYIWDYYMLKNSIKIHILQNNKWKNIIIDILKKSDKWIAPYILKNLKKHKILS
jgi:hypothetical protein